MSDENEINEVNIYNVINGGEGELADLRCARSKPDNPENDGRGKNYDSRGKNYDSRSSHSEGEYDSRFDTRGKNYDTRGKNYDTRGKNYDTRGKNYDTRGKNYDTRGKNYDTRGKNYDTRGKNYDNRGKNYDNRSEDQNQSLDDTVVNIYNIVNTGRKSSSRQQDHGEHLFNKFLGYDEVQREEGKPIGLSCHIGVNTLDVDHYGTDGALAACEYDAEDMNKIAENLGYQTVLFNTHDAVRYNVEAAITSAAKLLQEGDIFLLTYAGHGSQVDDVSSDEKDELDETWCLYDAQQIDDERRFMFTKFRKGVRILVVSDSCHSATTSRNIGRNFPKYGEMPVMERVMMDAIKKPNVRHAWRILDEQTSRNVYNRHREFYNDISLGIPDKKDWDKVVARIKTLSACKDEELASDGRLNGLFTEHLKAVYKEGDYDDDYNAFVAAVSHEVSSANPKQNPSIDDYGETNDEFDAQKPFTI